MIDAPPFRHTGHQVVGTGHHFTGHGCPKRDLQQRAVVAEATTSEGHGRPAIDRASTWGESAHLQVVSDAGGSAEGIGK